MNAVNKFEIRQPEPGKNLNIKSSNNKNNINKKMPNTRQLCRLDHLSYGLIVPMLEQPAQYIAKTQKAEFDA